MVAAQAQAQAQAGPRARGGRGPGRGGGARGGGDPGRLLGGVLLGLLAAAVAGAGGAAADFHRGDTVPLARRGQFNKQRTTWHDVQGRHAPHFAMDGKVLVPIPEPKGFDAAEDYKVSFSVDGGRHFTPWLPLLTKPAKGIPVVEMRLQFRGNRVTGVRAATTFHPMSSEVEQTWNTKGIAKEYTYPKVWPKHVLLDYRWEEEVEVDVWSGLMALFAVGIALSAAMMIGVIHTSKDKLALVLSKMAKDAMMGGDDLYGKGD